MFHIGDKVVHPMHGAGIVESIVQKKVNGVTRDYYILKLPVRAMVVMVPVEHCEEIGVRPIVDRALADRVLDEMASLHVEMTNNWNRRYRENMERLKSGDLFQVAQVVKGLMLRDVDRGYWRQQQNEPHSAGTLPRCKSRFAGSFCRSDLDPYTADGPPFPPRCPPQGASTGGQHGGAGSGGRRRCRPGRAGRQ